MRDEVAADRLVARARQHIRRVSAVEAARAVADGAVLVDIRPREYRERDGEVPGAIPVPRHVLEWRLDPTSPDRLPELAGPQTPIVLLCTQGYSSSLAAATCTRELGLVSVVDVVGGIDASRRAGLPWRPGATPSTW
ncbi:rhodanese-like domain-containing protein [Nitriliruptoraceae bacterium ZYF776]|nr:rhodanese-like domain-containing protein [Profundirhabdus halotolerans]